MSDSATATAPEPVAPAAPAAPAAPVQPAAEPAKALSRSEARAALHRDHTTTKTDPEPVTKTETADATATPAAPAATADPKTPAVPEPTTTAPAAFTVELGADHPAAAGGAAAIKVSTAEEERTLRALVNNFTRTNSLKAENQTLRSKLAEVRQEVVRRDSATAAQQEWMQSPQYKAIVARYTEIKDNVGPEAATDYWKAMQGQLRELESKKFAEGMASVDAEEKAAAADSWVQDAWAETKGIPEEIRTLAGFPQWFQETLEDFNHKLSVGHLRDVRKGDLQSMHMAFKKLLHARLVSEPSVSQAFNQVNQKKTQGAATANAAADAAKKREEQIAAKAIEDFKRSMADKRDATPPHPLGNLVRASSDRVPAATPTPDRQPDGSAAESTHDLRRRLRGESRDIGKRHLTQ